MVSMTPNNRLQDIFQLLFNPVPHEEVDDANVVPVLWTINNVQWIFPLRQQAQVVGVDVVKDIMLVHEG